MDRLEPMVRAFHAAIGLEKDPEKLRDVLQPLLQGSPHGAAYLIGPRVAPVGYIVVSFGYSIEMGGIDGFIDEFYIRENVRGRGMGTEVLNSLLPALAEHGVKALHLEVRENSRVENLFGRTGFQIRDGRRSMTRIFGENG